MTVSDSFENIFYGVMVLRPLEMVLLLLFEYLCYGFTAIINILTLTVRGSALVVRIWRLQTSDSDD